MTSLAQGAPLPDVKTTTSAITTAPDYYTNYLTNLADAGEKATAITDTSKLVAGFDQLQNQAFGALPTTAAAYKPELAAAQGTAALGAAGATPQTIQSFMNPYTKNVVDEMGRLQQQNIQQNIMPTLGGAFAGTGGFGSARQANATGQTLASMQANLLGQQQGALSSGYQSAVDAALKQAGLQNQAAGVQGTLAGQEQTLGLAGADAMLKAGAQKQALEQAKLEAPLKTATNAAALMRGYTVPTASTTTFTGPMSGAYSASPLQQLAGLGALFASGTGGTSAATGVYNFLKGLGGGTTGGTTGTGTSQTVDPNAGVLTQAQLDAIFTGGEASLQDQQQGHWDYDEENNPIWVEG